MPNITCKLLLCRNIKTIYCMHILRLYTWPETTGMIVGIGEEGDDLRAPSTTDALRLVVLLPLPLACPQFGWFRLAELTELVLFVDSIDYCGPG